MKTNFLILTLTALLLVNCKQNTESSSTKTATELKVTTVQTIAPAEFAEALSKEPNAQLIDVRSPKEFDSDHLEGAVNIDYNSPEFKSEIEKLDKSKPTFVYCLSGGRSASAIQTMKELGFTNLTELEGGMLKWRNSGVQQTAAVEAKGMTKNDFEKLINSDKKVLVDFNATWCGPCQMLSPILKQVKDSLGDRVSIIKIDVDKNQLIASQYQVRGVPTMILFQNGKQLWRQSGVLSATDLIKIIVEKKSPMRTRGTTVLGKPTNPVV